MELPFEGCSFREDANNIFRKIICSPLIIYSRSCSYRQLLRRVSFLRLPIVEPKEAKRFSVTWSMFKKSTRKRYSRFSWQIIIKKCLLTLTLIYTQAVLSNMYSYGNYNWLCSISSFQAASYKHFCTYI